MWARNRISVGPRIWERFRVFTCSIPQDPIISAEVRISREGRRAGSVDLPINQAVIIVEELHTDGKTDLTVVRDGKAMFSSSDMSVTLIGAHVLIVRRGGNRRNGSEADRVSSHTVPSMCVTRTQTGIIPLKGYFLAIKRVWITNPSHSLK